MKIKFCILCGFSITMFSSFMLGASFGAATILIFIASVLVSLLLALYTIKNVNKKHSALERANFASRAKGHFLSNMSHEIRTPINAVIGMTAIGKSARDSAGKDYALNKIETASKHLLGIINDILDISKVEAGKLELSPVSFNFRKMLEKVMDIIKFRMDEHRQKLHINIDKNIPDCFTGDDQKLSQIITNILANAIKFTPAQGSVHLDIELISEENGVYCLQISVTDDGIGITEDQKKHLFDIFEQADADITRKFGGTGLGLAISKNFIKMMGGEIWVESEFGKGSRFIFTVYLERGAAADNSGKNGFTEHGGAPDDSGDDDFTGHTILLAEDMEINREIVTAILEPANLTVECAENGRQALEMFIAAPDKYDLIFMDIQMPEMDGHRATRAIRSLDLDAAETIPIVAMTASVFSEDVEKCIDAGMNGHISKPLNVEELFDTLRKYLRRKEEYAS
ncbi:MAG: ATP-binding protein [Chitinispirillia bacterium]|nr:ATP-binding protein [Chitinispirillia bacterium]